MMRILNQFRYPAFCRCYLNLYRQQSYSVNLWGEDINTEIKKQIEKNWSKEVVKKLEYENNVKHSYILPMFPYPSGNLHMGHVRVYSISDTIARFEELSGNRSIHPIGWDAFGLPAENAAIERNIPPNSWTESNISSMRQQLEQLNYKFDWDRELSTCDPNYYRWTQYIFLKLYEQGMAYQSKAQVNWDPVDKTVLADEQVDDLGCSWRSGAKVEKKYLTQWFIKTTKFAKDLYNGLDSEGLENWKDIINLQKHWIGQCDGVVVEFKIVINNVAKVFDVWTAQPYKLIHGDFLTISSTHPLIQSLSDKMEPLICYNPISNCNIPVYISDKGPYPEGRDVLIAASAYDKDDLSLALSLNIPTTNKDTTVNIEKENQKAIDIALDKNVGGYYVSSKLKDWLISRQRYWGTPIPIIHCNQCGTVPVPFEQLPVKLPENDTSTSGIQTLEKNESWVNCKCPKCGSNAKRETDTMDTFVDSSWYYYRFLDPTNNKLPFSKECVKNIMPVDIYIGGKEHAVLHLYYARFMSYFFHSIGWTLSKEPFKRLVVQGMVMGQSYKLQSSGKYLPQEQVEKDGQDFKDKDTGEVVVSQWEKMSKSKYNGVNPEKLLTAYGVDTTRLLILADVPPATTRKWSDATLPGVLNWQHRLWITMREFLKCRKDLSSLPVITPEEFQLNERKIEESKNYFIATTTYHFRYTQKLSVGISRLQGLTNVLRNNVPPAVIARSPAFEKALACLIIMIAPVMPHFSSELWAGLVSAPNRLCDTLEAIDLRKNVLEQRWPKVDEDFELSFQCKVDGADRCELKIKASDLRNMKHDEALEAMLRQAAIQKRIKTAVHKTKYELYPDCRAILHIQTKRKEKKVTEMQNVGTLSQ